jgi:lysophospholipase L1-like esterase
MFRFSAAAFILKVLAVLAVAVLPPAGLAMQPVPVPRSAPADLRWVGTWSASPQAVSNGVAVEGRTIRQVVRVSAGGNWVRVRLSNAYGEDALAVGAVHVALHKGGAAIVAGSDRKLAFNGLPAITIPPGALAVSDPMFFPLRDLGDLAVSIYVSGNQEAGTGHTDGLQTTYISTEGNFSGEENLPTATTTQSVYFLTGVEVDAARGTRAIVALGDSITDGRRSSADANRRWPNLLAERLAAQKSGGKVAVLNAGISGNRLLHDKDSSNALARLDRDVLVQSGARYVIVLLGINDIGFPGAVTVDEIIAAHRQIIDRAHAMGLTVYGGTLTPFQAFLPLIYYTDVGEQQRQAVNDWIRTSNAYDAVIDFDQAIRDPGNPARILPAYDSGDHLHPNDAGYKAMADAISLKLFKDKVPARRPVRATRPAAQTGTPKP